MRRNRCGRTWHLWTGIFAVFLGAMLAGPAGADVTVNVIDDAAQPVANGFRWLLEEDNTYAVRKAAPDGPWVGAEGTPMLPGTPSPNAPWDPSPGAVNPSYTLGVNVHKSHAPVVCSGDTNTGGTVPGQGTGSPSVIINTANCAGYDAGKNYIVSVLPWHTCATTGADCTVPALQTGYMQSGRNIAPGQSTVTVVTHNFPMPTAQVTLLVFEDNQPINGAYDQPAEHGLANFQLHLYDPAGDVLQDAFGNPIGTTYQYACTMPDGRPAEGTLNPDRSVTCSSPLAPVLPERQPLYQYGADGLPVVAFLGDGNVFTCPGPTPGANPSAGYTPNQMANCIDPYSLTPLAAGEAVIRYITANKYGVEAIPPHPGTPCNSDSDCSDMLLTATLEGTRGNDVWLRAGEPRYNINLGQLNWLVFYPFVHPSNKLGALAGNHTGTISGQVVYVHDEHPPRSPGVNPGLPVTNAYVGLNNLSGSDEQVYTAAADPNTGEFTIAGVPPGTYQLAVWDKPINAIIDFRTVTIGDGQTVALGRIPIFKWFGKVTGTVFNDINGNGFKDSNDVGISNVPVNLRFSDGSIYQSGTTGIDGSYLFDQYFTWWRFLVAEVGANVSKATGVTSVVDDGGSLYQFGFGADGIRPQLQPAGSSPGGQVYRTQQQDGVVTQAFNVFQDMTARIDFGKQGWGPGENGGILGQINYATTRTEEDPAYSAIDSWEPGVPNVTVNLYKAVQDPNAIGGWVKDGTPILTVNSDSWNDHLPTGCIGSDPLWANPQVVNGFATPSCTESFHNWDQTRPGVFDGSYAFGTMPDGSPIPPGNYIVQVVPPTGYDVVNYGDRNIEFGDPKINFLKFPAPCVGPAYDVPQYHTLFPDQQVPTVVPGGWQPGTQAASCTEKLVTLTPGQTAPADFNLYTAVPKAARIWGTVWNDLMLEFDPNSPNAAGNLGVSYLPVAIKDWKGTEVARFYTDQWGHFDGLVPTNYDIAPPIPLGLVLSMYTIATNDPGPILDTRPGSPTNGQWITDPWFNPAYSQEVIRENWEFYPGKTTFIDTIVLPVSGFVGNRVPLNCDYTDSTPEIMQVSDVIIPQDTGGYGVTITSMGSQSVPNPDYNPNDPASPVTVTWDHGFGAVPGTVTVGGTPLTNVTWAADGGSISATVPNGVSGQLVVTRGDNGLATTVGVTLHIAGAEPVIDVFPPPANCSDLACGVIQPAVDAALPGSIIVLHPGVYQEGVNLWKPLTLQGYGAAVTSLDGTAALANFALKQQTTNQLQDLIASGAIGVVPGQASNFTLQQGSGILVAGCGNTPSCGPAGSNSSFFAPGASAQIDGLTITGAAVAGGGVLVNGYVANLKITNNEVFANQGSIGGGIRVGESALVGAGNELGSNFNPNLVIDHNRIAQNGSLFSGGGGVALYAGADNYRVTNNMICGNFSALYGGGIGHYGLSVNGLIEDNKIVSNESFDEGGGIHIAGELPPAGVVLSPGSGSVIVNRNLIQGNKAGDDGGGIRILMANGQDVANNPASYLPWHQIGIFNNIVVNNSSADHGGGMSFDDSVRLYVVGNTVARNDSTSTGADAFGGPCNEATPGQGCPPGEVGGGIRNSVPQVGGIAAFAFSTALQTAVAASSTVYSTDTYTNPQLVDNIIWQNRSYYWNAAANQGLGELRPNPAGLIWDLAVYGTAAPVTMSPTYSILTNGVGATADPSNLIGAYPKFVGDCASDGHTAVGSCYNVYQTTSAGAALGNFVVATFTPNGIQGDYHIQIISPAIGAGSGLVYNALQATDYDNQPRMAPVDIGADQTGVLVSPLSLDFGSVPVGTSAVLPLTLTNPTTLPITVSITKDGAFPGMFGVASPVAVPAHSSVDVNVSFNPPSTTVVRNTKTANLNIKPQGSNAAPIVVTLSGTAQ